MPPAGGRPWRQCRSARASGSDALPNRPDATRRKWMFSRLKSVVTRASCPRRNSHDRRSHPQCRFRHPRCHFVSLPCGCGKSELFPGGARRNQYSKSSKPVSRTSLASFRGSSLQVGAAYTARWQAQCRSGTRYPPDQGHHRVTRPLGQVPPPRLGKAPPR